MPVKAWTCDGCTNYCYLLFKGEVGKYCKVGYFPGKWKGKKWFRTGPDEEFIACLDKTSDPSAEDKQVRIFEMMKYTPAPVKGINGKPWIDEEWKETKTRLKGE